MYGTRPREAAEASSDGSIRARKVMHGQIRSATAAAVAAGDYALSETIACRGSPPSAHQAAMIEQVLRTANPATSGNTVPL